MAGLPCYALLAEGGHEATVNALLAAGAEVDKADSDGRTPLLYSLFN